MRTLTWNEVASRRLAALSLAQQAPATRLVEVVGAACGLQAQVMSAAELGLSVRVADIVQQDVRRVLWETRRLVKTYSLRGTLHIHPASELPLWTAARQALPDMQGWRWHTAYGLEQPQAESVLAAMRDALDGQELTREQLADGVAQRVGAWARERLASTWADLVGIGFDTGLICFGPSQGSKVTFVRTDQWIGSWEPIDPDRALAEVFRRYLAAYGPATTRDFAQWFAGSKLAPDVARKLAGSLSDELEEVKVGAKHALMRTADLDTFLEQTATSLRLLPQYDCYILGARFGREQIVPEAAQARIRSYKNGRFEGATGRPVLLINGVVSGMWELRKKGKQTEIRVESFATLTRQQREQLEAEAVRIGQFLGAKATLMLGALD